MIVLYVILAIAAVLLVNTALQTRKARPLEGQHPTFTEEELALVMGENARKVYRIR